jgi:hypothetical protein
LIIILFVACMRVVAPSCRMLWALILAIALYPLHRPSPRLAAAAATDVLVRLLLIGTPTVMLGGRSGTH